MTACLVSKHTKVAASLAGTILSILLVVGLTGCCWFQAIAHHDTSALATGERLKAESLLLVAKATEPFSAHATEVMSLRTELDAALAYEKARCKNQLTVEQWIIITDPNGHSLGGLLSRWEQETTLDSTFIALSSSEIGKHFDRLISLEREKPRRG